MRFVDLNLEMIKDGFNKLEGESDTHNHTVGDVVNNNKLVLKIYTTKT